MSGFRERVIHVVKAVPYGRVVTYGQVALLAGAPRAARHVGYVLRGLHQDSDNPWHRVVNAQGKISTYRVGVGELQRALLEHEGIEFDGEERIDLARYRWEPGLEWLEVNYAGPAAAEKEQQDGQQGKPEAW